VCRNRPPLNGLKYAAPNGEQFLVGLAEQTNLLAVDFHTPHTSTTTILELTCRSPHILLFLSFSPLCLAQSHLEVVVVLHLGSGNLPLLHGQSSLQPSS